MAQRDYQNTRWIKTCSEFKSVRKAIDDDDYVSVLTQLIAICDEYAKEEWDFAEDYEEYYSDESTTWIMPFYNEDAPEVDYYYYGTDETWHRIPPGEFFDFADLVNFTLPPVVLNTFPRVLAFNDGLAV